MKFKSIVSRIIVSVIPILAVTITIFISVVYRLSYEQTDMQYNEKMSESIRVASLDIQLELQKNANITKEMGIYGSVSGLDTVRSRELAAYVKQCIWSNENTVGGGIWYEPAAVYEDRTHYSAYAYREGNQMVVTMDYADTVDYLAEPWYVDAKAANGRMIWTDVYYDPVADVTMITSSKAFYNENGQMLGVATADMALTDIQSIASRISIGETGRAFIIGSRGEYISYFDNMRGVEQSIHTDENEDLASLGDELFANDSGVYSMRLDGKALNVYYNTLHDVEWKLIVLLNANEIRSSALVTVLTMASVPVFGLMLASLSILYVTRHIRRVVTKVNSFADKAASGNWTERIKVLEADEFGKMEEHLNEMMAKMSEMNRRSTEALEAAQAANRAKSEFLSRMSHEIRTPLNGITGMTQVASETEDIARVRECMRKISIASKHLLSLINDVLDMSKIEANKLELYNESFNLLEAIEGVTSLVDVKAGEKSQTFEVKLDEALPFYVKADELRLAQVLLNLLSNAVKFTPEEGVIGLTVRMGETLSDKRAVLYFNVSDTGIGIEEENKSRLFGSFEQADVGISRKFGGTGLGLAISKNIVELMGGSITVESELGQGSVFSFNIHVQVCDEAEMLAEAEKTLDNLDLSGKTILIAEDIELNREVAAAVLEGTGAAIEFAENGVQAVRMFEASEGRYSVVLMDVQMPEMDGYEATRAIRAMQGGADIAIIALSANALQSDVRNALAAGMNDHISKPIDPDLLYAKLAKYVK